MGSFTGPVQVQVEQISRSSFINDFGSAIIEITSTVYG